ncbi:MAG: hypothetical protein ACP5N2_01715 [Candidatus Nanoarchaeia archaeon]
MAKKTKKKIFSAKVRNPFVEYWQTYKNTLSKDAFGQIYHFIGFFVLIAVIVFLCNELLKTMFTFIKTNFPLVFPSYVFVLLLLAVVIFIFIMSNLVRAPSKKYNPNNVVLWLLAIFLIMGVWNVYLRFIITLIALALFLPETLQSYKRLNFGKLIFLGVLFALFWLGLLFIQGTYGLDYNNLENIQLHDCNKSKMDVAYNLTCIRHSSDIYSGVGIMCLSNSDLKLSAKQEQLTVTYESGNSSEFEFNKFIILNETMDVASFLVYGMENNESQCYMGSSKLRIYTKSELLWHKEKTVIFFLGLLYLILFFSPDLYEKWRRFIIDK